MRVHDLHGVARGAEDVALGLHLDGGVDVADDRRDSGLRRRNSRTGSTGQPSTRLQLASRSGTTTMRCRIQHLGRLRHEPDAAEGDHVALELARLAGQFQAVAHHVGQFLNLRLLVVMRQQDGLALLLQLQNLVGNRGCGVHGSDVDFSLSSARHNGNSEGRPGLHLRAGPAAFRAGVAGGMAARRRPPCDGGRPGLQPAPAHRHRAGRPDRVLPAHAHRHAPVPARVGPREGRESRGPTCARTGCMRR